MGALVDFADKVEKFLEGLCFGSGLIDFRIGSISQFNFEKIAFSPPDIPQASTLTWHHCHIRDAEDVAELLNKLEGLGITFSKNEAQNILKSGPVFLEAADKRFFKFSQLSRRDDGRVIQNDIFAITKGAHLVTIVVGDSNPPAIDLVIKEVSSTTTNSEEIVPDLSEDLASPIALLFRILGSTCYANRDIASEIQAEISDFSKQHRRALPSGQINGEIERYEDISSVIQAWHNQTITLLAQINSGTVHDKLFEDTFKKYHPIITTIDQHQKEIERVAQPGGDQMSTKPIHAFNYDCHVAGATCSCCTDCIYLSVQ